nr:hypothetical protein [Lachnospiraceae bacterium]
MDIRKLRISEIYYILIALGYVSTLFIYGMRPGIFGAFLMVLVIAELAFSRRLKLGRADIIFAAYFAYQILSVIWLTLGGFPFSVFAEEFASSALPMVFYFAGKSAGSRRKIWYRNYIIAVLAIGIIGVIFYALAPQFYCDWAYRWSYISKADAATARVRMHSVVGSTCLSYLSVAGMLAGAFFLGEAERSGAKADHSGAKADRSGADTEGSEKGSSKRKNIIFSVSSMVLCFVFAVMANQRSGLVVAALVIIYVNYLLFFRLDLIPRKFFAYEVIAIAAVFAAICFARFGVILKFWWRIESLPTAISQRSEQWVAAVNNMYSSWIGNGLGANGHKAIGIEDAHVIADGGLVKLYCENGVIGFSMFVYLLVLAFGNAGRNIKDHFAEAGIMAAALLQSIGSNILAFQLCAPVFWFA